MFKLGLLLSMLSVSGHAQEVYLNSLWELQAGDEPFVSGTANTERGMAYNPATNHLLLASRTPSSNVHILDADDGTVLGELSMNGVSGGTFVINKIEVASDGTIYAGNLSLDTTTSPYRLYRWADENSDPVAVFAGDPSQGDPEPKNRRFGDSLAVRGTGSDTKILLATWQGTIFSYLTPGEDGSFSAQPIATSIPGGDVRNLSFADGNFAYGSHNGTPLYELEFDAVEKAVTVLRSFNGAIISSDMTAVAVNATENWLGGVRTGAHAVALYRRSELTTEWTVVPVVSRSFATTNTNGNGTGAIIFDGTRIFALDTNNGVMALQISDSPPPFEPVAPGEIYWTNADEIRTAELDGSNPRTVLGGLTRAIGVAIDPVRHHVYYTDDAAGIIGRAGLDGSNRVEVLTGRANPQFVEIKDDQLFWAEWDAGLFRANLDGSDAQQLINLGPGGQSTSVVVGSDGAVYLGSAAGELYRPTENPEAPELILTYTAGSYGLAAHPSDGNLYATSFNASQIFSINMNNGQETWLNYQAQPLGIDLTRDGTEMVWAERSAGAIVISNLSATSPTTLVSGENSPFGVVVVPELAELPLGFAGWIGQFALPADQESPQDDPDADSIPNLIEYALGGDPTTGDHSILPVTGFESDGGNEYLALAMAKNPDATDVTYHIETSSDLIGWNSGSEFFVVVEETGSSLVVRDVVPLSTESKRFIRLRVELN